MSFARSLFCFLTISLMSFSASAATPAFSVHKNGTAQTVAQDTDVKLTWSTEGFDTNNNFASDRFTPTVAGKYLIVASAQCLQAGACMPSIYKNGVLVARSQSTNVNIGQTPQVTTIVDMNGSTDYVEAFITSAGSIIGGGADRTYFSGTQIDGGGSGGVPTGTIAAFATASCPSGWTEYTAARGRFLRGIDNGAGVDPDGTRTPSSLQSDEFKIHQHLSGSTDAYVSGAAGLAAASTQNRNGTTTGRYTGDTGGAETRPQNVAVIFCQYAGGASLVAAPSGAAGAIQLADGAGGLSSNASVVVSGGNVGIGTTSPNTALTVSRPSSNGTIGIPLQLHADTANSSVAGTGYGIRFTSGTYGSPSTFGLVGGFSDGSNLGVGLWGAAITGTPNLFAASGGRVGIGTTAPSSQVELESDTPYIQYDDTDTTNDWLVGNGNGNFLFVHNGTTVRLSLAPTGILTVTGTSTCTIASGSGATNCTSDARLKKSVMPIQGALEKLSKLKGVTYHWKDPAKSKPEYIGLLAQDVKRVFPQAVGEVDEPSVPGGKAMTLDYAVLVAPLIEAVKELKGANDNLQADNVSLRKELRETIASQDAEIDVLRRQVEAMSAVH